MRVMGLSGAHLRYAESRQRNSRPEHRISVSTRAISVLSTPEKAGIGCVRYRRADRSVAYSLPMSALAVRRL